MKKPIFALTCTMLATCTFAQVSDHHQLNYVYPQKVIPAGIDNYLFSTYYYSGKKTFNLRGATMSSSDSVASLKINPSGTSFAVLSKKGERGFVEIYDLWKSDKMISKIEMNGVKP